MKVIINCYWEVYKVLKLQFTVPCVSVYMLCICTQTLSPHNKGLIKRAISQSGVALCPWAVNRNPRQFAEKVRIPTTTYENILGHYSANTVLSLALVWIILIRQVHFIIKN